MKKMFLMLIFLVLLAGCGTPQKKDAVIIGVDDTFAPMGFRDENNELVGFDIDLAQALAEKMNIEIEFQPIDWSMKETELNAGNIDLIWNGYSITEKRKQQVNFSDAYLENRQIIVVLSESKITSKSDLAKKSVAVQKESSALEAVLKESGLASSFTGGKPVEFDTNIDCFMDLESKRSDAIVCDEVLARYVIKQRGEDNYRILDEDFGTEEYGIGVRKSDEDLLNQLNEALRESISDGTFNQIYEKWFAK